eukprot:11514503-Prorocentrum_lima.AAC.1
MKVAKWAGHVHMSIRRILRADAMCVEAHNTLENTAPGQGLILQGQRFHADLRQSGHPNKG